jgi:hypothetical protein
MFKATWHKISRSSTSSSPLSLPRWTRRSRTSWTPVVNQHEYFKSQLLDIHQLSDYKKFDYLTTIKLMSCRKLSQLLEFCPVGMEKHLSVHFS